MVVGTAGAAQSRKDPGSGKEAPSSWFQHRGLQREPTGWSEVASWRQSARQTLLQQRMLMAASERNASSARIASGLDRTIGRISGRIIGLYWPIRGEPNLYRWISKAIDAGASIALPVVIRKGWPLEFRQWHPGEPLERGVWNIPVPARGPALFPDIVVAPVVGFDDDCFRLGYGGGFYDRTIAIAARRPYLIGVGYARSRLSTIYPQPHDIRMDTIVTDA